MSGGVSGVSDNVSFAYGLWKKLKQSDSVLSLGVQESNNRSPFVSMMFRKIFSFWAIAGSALMVTGLAHGMPVQSGGESKVPGLELPQFPSELYARLSEATRPQWRQHYRATVTRCLEGREQAAMGLGAVTADLFLAGSARDTQQIRNLLQDEQTIEKTLGLIEAMAGLRTEILAAAEQADWARLNVGLEKLSTSHRKQLRIQKDERLADLAYIGQWLRTLQTCHAVVRARELTDAKLAIGDPGLVAEMNRRLLTMSDPATETNRCLRLLHKRLAGLSRLWPEGAKPAPLSAERLRRSTELLSDTVGQLIQNEDPATGGILVAPK